MTTSVPTRESVGAGTGIPRYGAGLGYRRQLMTGLWDRPESVDVLEILAENWVGPGVLADLRELAATFRVVPHGVSLSPAGAGPPPPDFLDQLAAIVDATAATYYSDHLALTQVPGLSSGHLCTPVLTADSLRQAVRNVRVTQSALGVPVALENITYTVTLPGSIDGADFVAEVADRTGALLLLDVANLYINSVNHGFDPADQLDRLPLEKVVHIHLAGGFRAGGKLVDSHSEPVGEEVWALAREVAGRTSPATVILEHDAHFPDLDVLLDQVRRARSLFFPESCTGSRGRPGAST